MKNESYLKYLLSDLLSLKKYYREKKSVNLRDIQRAVMLRVRDRGYSVPDHYYRLGIECSFYRIEYLSEIFTKGLSNLANEYLEIHNNRIYVRGNKFNDWQLLLPLIPPLLLVTIKVWNQYGPITEPITDYSYKYLLPSLKFTAIPPAYIQEMEIFKHENEGFDDLHIHLNGTIETDIAWHDFLKFPEIIYQEIRKSYKNEIVKEQFEQLTDISEPIDFLNIFRIAGNLRKQLFNITSGIYDINLNSLDEYLTVVFNKRKYDNIHPHTSLFGEGASPLILESSLYIKILDHLAKHPSDNTTAGIFHYYLLILGLCNRLLVQQTESFGFEQFQKYTSNNLREHSEKAYKQRFFQLSGNNLNYINNIEGRFSPKDRLEDNVNIINKIILGFNSLTNYQAKNKIPRSKLSLVAHYIKKKDNGDNDIRHYSLRNELKNKTNTLIALKNTKSLYANILKGIDAAASEFDTPPEVFAPSFNTLRKHGINSFTFHAGEDFFHILSGLRTIYEAITFLNMHAGDRIGHATATGIDIKLWEENIGKIIWMRKQVYMDDLIFTYHLITENKDKFLEHLLPIIALKVEQYSSEIYESTHSIHTLIQAWKMRKEDPFMVCDNSEQSNVVLSIYNQYHSRTVKNKGDEIIQVGAYDIFSEKELTHLQHLLLKIMHEKEIIIETLPTSNVIIGQHKNFSTYHLFNWYKWSKEGIKIPSIVIGTDDAGIFATNIYNEYCHIYSTFVFDKGLTPNDTMEYIKQLAHNAKVYSFK